MRLLPRAAGHPGGRSDLSGTPRASTGLTMRRIAVDAMGTDLAPHTEVEGAILAAREGLAHVILVGPEEALQRELGRRGHRAKGIEIVHASEAITMEEAAAKSFRRKRDSSIRSEEHTSELQSLAYLVCRLLLEKKKKQEHIYWNSL